MFVRYLWRRFFCAVLILFILIWLWFCLSDSRNGALRQDCSFSVPCGAGTVNIANLLQEQNIIRYPCLFCLSMRIQWRDKDWQPVTCVIPAKSGYREIAELLSETVHREDITVMIREGLEIKEIARLLDDAGVCGKEEFLDACDNGAFPYTFLSAADLPGRIKLEGYLFPDTYRFYPDSEPETVICRMLERFQEVLYTEEYRSRAEEMGYSFDEMLILASIIESEAATKSDREDVSAVFHHRLEQTSGQMLQSCVTVEYALGIHKNIISLPDTQYESPYNTYLHPGLPIGPICCPGEESLRAALWPAENSYFYFQSDQNGKLWFASTLREHIKNQNTIQRDWKVETRIVGE